MATRGLNRTTILGFLGADPEIRTLPSGAPVTTISVATTDEWTDKDSGDSRSRTDWHRIVFHDRRAEIAAEYLRKGSQVYIEGANRSDKYQDKDTGEDRYAHYIRGQELKLLDRRPDTVEYDESVSHDEIKEGEGGHSG